MNKTHFSYQEILKTLQNNQLSRNNLTANISETIMAKYGLLIIFNLIKKKGFFCIFVNLQIFF